MKLIIAVLLLTVTTRCSNPRQELTDELGAPCYETATHIVYCAMPDVPIEQLGDLPPACERSKCLMFLECPLEKGQPKIDNCETTLPEEEDMDPNGGVPPRPRAPFDLRSPLAP